MRELTASCCHLVADGTPCILLFENRNFSKEWGRRGNTEGQKRYILLDLLDSFHLFLCIRFPHLSTVLFAPGGSAVWYTQKNSSCLLASDWVWPMRKPGRRWDKGRREWGEGIYSFSFFPAGLLRLVVTFDPKSLLLSRSWLLSRWPLSHNTPIWLPSGCSLPSSFSHTSGNNYTVTRPWVLSYLLYFPIPCPWLCK